MSNFQNNNIERGFEWDDTIQNDGGPEFIVLPSGDYRFSVTKFERGRFPGSTKPDGSIKMPACNQAKIDITVHSPEKGDVVIIHTLLLHTKTEGFLSNFFAGIGQKKKGEPLRMNWQAVVGSRGVLKLEESTFTNTNTGQPMKNNKIKTFYAPDEVPAQFANNGAAQQQQYQQPMGQGQQQQQGQYQQPNGQYQQQNNGQYNQQQGQFQQQQQQTPFPGQNQTGGTGNFTNGHF